MSAIHQGWIDPWIMIAASATRWIPDVPGGSSGLGFAHPLEFPPAFMPARSGSCYILRCMVFSRRWMDTRLAHRRDALMFFHEMSLGVKRSYMHICRPVDLSSRGMGRRGGGVGCSLLCFDSDDQTRRSTPRPASMAPCFLGSRQ